jgi:hypothetical protein
MLVLPQAEWFTATFLVSGLVSGGHSVAPISRTANLIWFIARDRDDRPPWPPSLTEDSAGFAYRMGAAAVSPR